MERLEEARVVSAPSNLPFIFCFGVGKSVANPSWLRTQLLVNRAARGKGKYRALRELKNLGLIDLEWRPRKSPRVTILTATERKL